MNNIMTTANGYDVIFLLLLGCVTHPYLKIVSILIEHCNKSKNGK